MKVVQEKLSEGVNEHGLTLTEFQCIHASLIENGFHETPWIVLRNFEYNDDTKLEDDQIPALKRAPDQVFFCDKLWSLYCFLYLSDLFLINC